MTDFEKALKDLPPETDLDAHHATVEDLSYLCLHELDLHAEGEYEHPKKLLKAYRAFIAKWGPDWIKAEAAKLKA
jgi:hypothetical protein